MKFTDKQQQRLLELGSIVNIEQDFDSPEERDRIFASCEQSSILNNRAALMHYRTQRKAPPVNALSESIALLLRKQGFIEVSTPLIISQEFLKKMTITEKHDLSKQVFWLDDRSCLRPMLAPNLYDISRRLLKIYDMPLGVFEIGPCFRKESLGGRHLESFTMINLVEWGIEESTRDKRLTELVSLLMNHIGLPEYTLEAETSVVYGDTLDVMVDDVEVASGAFGPHPLDSNWSLAVSWVGLGLGLERAIMLRDDLDTIQKAGRSLRYLGGTSLNFK